MKKIIMLGLAVAFGCTLTAIAQDASRDENRDRRGGGERGGWDPATMQKRIMDGIKERLEVTDETEWKVMQPKVEAVLTAQRQVMGDRMRGLMGRRSSDRGPGGGDSERRSGYGSGLFGQPNPDAETLQRAIESKASKSELKEAVEKYQASRKMHQAELEKAQAELRKLLTTRQEAIAILNGLL